MTIDEKFDDNSPLSALIFLFHKNNHKYLNDSLKEYDLNINQGLFLLRINYIDDICQDDLANFFYLSKGYVAKSLRNLEDNGFIFREYLENNKRKYLLSLTPKGEEMIPIIHRINKDWETKMGLNELDDEFMEIIRDLTFRSIKLNE